MFAPSLRHWYVNVPEPVAVETEKVVNEPEHTVLLAGLAVICGALLTVTEKLAEDVPLPQEFWPLTVRFPDVAFAAKSIVTELPVPFIVAPVPEYDQL